MKSRYLTVAMAVLFMLLVVNPTAQAQNVDARHVSVNGQIAGIDGTDIGIIGTDGILCIGDLDPARTHNGITMNGLDPLVIKIEGAVNTDYLQVGVIVRFKATVIDRQIEEAISEITVLGIDADPAGTYGLLPDVGDDRYIVVGKIERVGRSSIRVKVPLEEGRFATLNAQLDENVAVDINASDLRFVNQGDQVVCEGVTIDPPHHIFVETLTITPSVPVEEEQPDHGEFAGGDNDEQEPAGEEGEDGGEEQPARPVFGRVIRIN